MPVDGPADTDCPAAADHDPGLPADAASRLGQTLSSSQLTSIVFMFAGEGAHSTDTDISMLKTSPAWAQIDTALLTELHQPSLEHFLRTGMY